ncbi:MAG: glycosyltransferase family 2 protein [Fidelibacterota bacterium]
MFRLELSVFTAIVKNQSDISVIIPTYNRAHSLPRALDSISIQTLMPKEIIVINDGSTDDTQAVLDNYPGLVIVDQENRGVSAARNKGIEKAGGKWIAFLDSDDEWLPNKLEKQWSAICNNNKLVCHTEEIWVRNGKRVNPMKKHQKFGGWIYNKCLPLCVISPSSVMIHQSVFDTVGNFDESLDVCEDYDLWLRICAKYPVLFVDEPLIVKYGGHKDQLSKKHWGMDRFRVRALEKMLESDEVNETQQKATRNILVEKCKIIINGMKKRRKIGEIAEWEEILKKYG